MAAFDLCVPRAQEYVRPGFEVLNKESIKYYQKEAIKKVSEVLVICPDEAFVLLQQFQWCGDHVLDSWFDGKIDTSLYLRTPPPPPLDRETHEYLCQICLDIRPIRMAFPILCGHHFCRICLRAHFSVAIKDRTKALLFKCPEHGCNRTLGANLIKGLAMPLQLQRYKRFAVESYVADNCKVKWCPVAGCNDAIAARKEDLGDVECSALHLFCWKCSFEGHYPVECTVAKEWLKSHHNEEESDNWKLLHTKLCPKCKLPIHRDGGCNHMTCTMCKFEFCWVCLRQWTASHGDYRCEPQTSTSFPDKISRVPHTSNAEVIADYHRLFRLCERDCEVAKLGSKRFQFKNRTGWFEIRRCRSISKWFCVLASFYGLDMTRFREITEDAKGQLQILLSCVLGEAPEIRIEDCIQKTRRLYEQMVAKLEWEGQWNLEDSIF